MRKHVAVEHIRRLESPRLANSEEQHRSMIELRNHQYPHRIVEQLDHIAL